MDIMSDRADVTERTPARAAAPPPADTVPHPAVPPSPRHIRPGRRPSASPYLFLLCYSGAFLAVELLLRAFTTARTMPYMTAELPLLCVFTVLTAALLCAVCFWIPRLRLRRILLTACLAAEVLAACSQLIYYHMMGTYYGLFSVTRAGQVTEFGSSIGQCILKDSPCILLMLLPLAGIVWDVLRMPAVGRLLPRPQKLILSGIPAALYAVGITAVLLGSDRDLGPRYLYFRAPDSTASVRTYGVPTALRLELRFLAFGSPLGDVGGDTPVNLPTASASGTSAPTASDADSSTEPQPEPQDQVLDIDFDALLRGESDSNLRVLHTYFQAVTPTKINAYTGRFRGKNLITVTAESFDSSAVRADLTPTLYKMAHEGLEFTNFYTPGWGVSTLDGEYVNTLSLLPKGGVWSLYRASKNNLYFALGNTAGRAGYQTWAFHDYQYNYYDRDLSHPNLGYTYFGIGGGLSLPSDYMWPPSDVELMEATPSYYLGGSQPFCVYYLTVSGHMPYSYIGNMMSIKNRALTEHLPYDEQGRAYLASQIELDRALELLLRTLSEAGVLEDTLIVLSADHYPYGISDEALSVLRGTEVDSNFERYRNTLIVYNPTLEHRVIDKPCYSLDILPTVQNLMGFEYDSRLLMGRDILSDSEGLVIFQNRSWITERGRYHALTGVFTPAEGMTADEEYVASVNAVVSKKFSASVGVLDTDYYGVLFDRNSSD